MFLTGTSEGYHTLINLSRKIYRVTMKNIIDHMKLNNLHTHRGTCPSCGGHNTLTCTYNPHTNRYIFNCYRISCQYSGTVRDVSSMDSLNQFKGIKEARTASSTPFYLPTYLTYGLSSPSALKWLQDKHALEAYERGYYSLWQDNKEDRIVIPMYEAGTSRLVNAIGRGWHSSVVPKVKVYGRGRELPPFICGYGKNVVIVEDFASAAHVSVLDNYIGFAILGTQFNLSRYLPYLQKLRPDKIIVALDKDAIVKALVIANSLTTVFKVEVLPLNTDIKDMNTNNLQEILQP